MLFVLENSWKSLYKHFRAPSPIGHPSCGPTLGTRFCLCYFNWVSGWQQGRRNSSCDWFQLSLLWVLVPRYSWACRADSHQLVGEYMGIKEKMPPLQTKSQRLLMVALLCSQGCDLLRQQLHIASSSEDISIEVYFGVSPTCLMRSDECRLQLGNEK